MILISFEILLAVSPADASSSKHKFPTSISQGQFLRLTFGTGSERSGVSLNLEDERSPCYLNGEEWECLAAVPANAKTGRQDFKILTADKVLFSGKIRVLKHKFPVETLTLSQDKKDLLKPSEDKENNRKLIREKFKTENQKKLWSGKFAPPVNGKIESLYGEKRIMDGKLRPNYYHRGLDLGSPHGTPILASNDGQVIAAGKFIEEGNMVMVDHGQGVISVYMHCSSMSLKEGDPVKKGQEVGKVGSTGVSTSPHVHFGIYIHGTPIDPLYWFDHNPN